MSSRVGWAKNNEVAALSAHEYPGSRRVSGELRAWPASRSFFPTSTMASGKTLSAGTLNLKFMQNVIRSQQIQAVELPRAQVKDDGEWEVSREVREAWGLLKKSGESSSQSKEVDVHEDSYLPFLFQADDEPSTSMGYKGRRQFGKNGKEVEAKPAESDSQPLGEQADDSENAKGRKVHPRPVSISDKSGGFLRGFGQLEKSANAKVNRKTAREMVFETTSGGPSDHRPSMANAASVSASDSKPSTPVTASAGSATAAPAQFLKPAGVDEPTAVKEKKSKRKRETTATPDTNRERPKKSKKQKKDQT
ncbi:hypothetical protein NMY22_g9576 [Coprinellus aureogranulatus]|nr:hypothetical protein NMY22_g9576 [Coprinellus aureogranulatus]